MDNTGLPTSWICWRCGETGDAKSITFEKSEVVETKLEPVHMACLPEREVIPCNQDRSSFKPAYDLGHNGFIP